MLMMYLLERLAARETHHVRGGLELSAQPVSAVGEPEAESTPMANEVINHVRNEALSKIPELQGLENFQAGEHGRC